ncbi:MAG: hypothetical protein WAN07_18895 [Candidatus Binatus sp.]
MNMRRKNGIRVESSSAVSGKWNWPRVLASTRSGREDSQLDRHLVASCSLMLAVVLVVGIAGYSVIERFSSSTPTTAKLAILERLNCEAAPDRIFTPAAIALAMIAVFIVAMAARSASPRKPQSIPYEGAYAE